MTQVTKLYVSSWLLYFYLVLLPTSAQLGLACAVLGEESGVNAGSDSCGPASFQASLGSVQLLEFRRARVLAGFALDALCCSSAIDDQRSISDLGWVDWRSMPLYQELPNC